MFAECVKFNKYIFLHAFLTNSLNCNHGQLKRALGFIAKYIEYYNSNCTFLSVKKTIREFLIKKRAENCELEKRAKNYKQKNWELLIKKIAEKL